LQAQCRRPADLPRRRAHQTRQSLARLPPRRAHAMELGSLRETLSVNTSHRWRKNPAYKSSAASPPAVIKPIHYLSRRCLPGAAARPSPGSLALAILSRSAGEGFLSSPSPPKGGGWGEGGAPSLQIGRTSESGH